MVGVVAVVVLEVGTLVDVEVVVVALDGFVVLLVLPAVIPVEVGGGIMIWWQSLWIWLVRQFVRNLQSLKSDFFFLSRSLYRCSGTSTRSRYTLPLRSMSIFYI